MGITWEPIENLDCIELINRFERENPLYRNKTKPKNIPTVIKLKPSNQSKRKHALKASRQSTSSPIKKNDNKLADDNLSKYSDEYVVESIVDRDVINID